MTLSKRWGLYWKVLGLGGTLLLGVMLAAITLGVANISPREAGLIILSRIPGLASWISLDGINPSAVVIVWQLRLPRILLAAVSGAGLAVAGATFQGIFRNPMAEPYVLGVSSGAALGATLAMISGLTATLFGLGLVALAAFAGGLLTVGLVYRIARTGGRLPEITLLLAGIAVNFFLNAVISLIMTFQHGQIERIVLWTMGSVATANWNEASLVTPVVGIAAGAIFWLARDLNLLLLGDETAQSLGVEVARAKKKLLLLCTLLVSAIVSVSGVIGFVGLIVPHGVRLIFGADHRAVIPFSALGGAILLVVCDTLARILVPPGEIPLGVITALLGVPFFLYLVAKNKKKVM